MKYLLISTIITSTLFSCGNEQTDILGETTEEPISINDSIHVENEETKKDVIQADTFYFGNQQLIITPIKDTSCFATKNTSTISKEEKILAQDSTVRRSGDSLIFTLNNQDTLILVNTASSTDKWSDFGYNYLYEGDHKSIDYWEVFAIGYESHSTILINKNSGHKTNWPGDVSVSPDQNYVAIYNADQEANYTTNHITLFQTQSDSLKELCFIDLDLKKWAPYDIRWTSPTAFQLKQGRFSEKEGYLIVYNCAEGKLLHISK